MHFDWTAAGAWTAVVVYIIGFAFIYGKLTQSVNDHGRRIGDLEDWKTSHEAEHKTLNQNVTRVLVHLNLDK